MLTNEKFHEVIDPIIGILGDGWSCHDEEQVEDGWKFVLEWLPADEPEEYRVVSHPLVTLDGESTDEQVADLHTATLAAVGAIFVTHADRKRHLVAA